MSEEAYINQELSKGWDLPIITLQMQYEEMYGKDLKKYCIEKDLDLDSYFIDEDGYTLCIPHMYNPHQVKMFRLARIYALGAKIGMGPYTFKKFEDVLPFMRIMINRTEVDKYFDREGDVTLIEMDSWMKIDCECRSLYG